MKTKRMKKLLMGMGLSRNQATRMIQEQRAEGSTMIAQNAKKSNKTQERFRVESHKIPGGWPGGHAGRRLRLR